MNSPDQIRTEQGMATAVTYLRPLILSMRDDAAAPIPLLRDQRRRHSLRHTQAALSTAAAQHPCACEYGLAVCCCQRKHPSVRLQTAILPAATAIQLCAPPPGKHAESRMQRWARIALALVTAPEAAGKAQPSASLSPAVDCIRRLTTRSPEGTPARPSAASGSALGACGGQSRSTAQHLLLPAEAATRMLIQMRRQAACTELESQG